MNVLEPSLPLFNAPEGAGAERGLAPQGRLPLPVLAAIGERLAASASSLQAGRQDAEAELARLERWGLQLQALAQVVSHAQQLRHERVDLGLALLQTVAEWSAEAARLGVDLHGPARSIEVDANPAALKHLLDLMIEHALQQGHTVRLDIEGSPGAPFARMVVHADAAPATSSPTRDTLAWQLLLLLARALSLAPLREPVAGGERLMLALPVGG